ncbi:MAG: NADPH-dependent 7-cyano-7-deazaguanine reductase QueF [Gammaproteobacteria bacterium]|nr:NADPH-dependent 7-cyano-7-deazaguanine reductase QueF [Gammaproteobacteria bacterium]
MASENPLGKVTPIAEHYSPELLFPISRTQARAELGLTGEALPFRGEDVWRAWEVSWLGVGGRPEIRVGRFRIPCTSPQLVESKSLKLYLNSLNQTEYASAQQLLEIVQADLSSVTGAAVQVELLPLDSELIEIRWLQGVCLDHLQPTAQCQQPDAGLLQTVEQPVDEVLYSHLLRSLCPVTAQPDWASLIVRYSGDKILPESLLAYILSYRRHQEFHEQCVERIFCDLLSTCQPSRLSVQALYTRRGGLDISPFRSTEQDSAGYLRCARQ